MTRQNIEAALRANIGVSVKIWFDGHTETVVVISVDSDGLLCRAVSAEATDITAEFWLAYKEISRVERT